MPEAPATAEVRWFVAGDLPAHRVPRGPGRRRVDSYYVPSLSPVSSVKRRGDRRLELKVRVGRVELVEHGAVVGYAERWLKSRLAPTLTDFVPGPWIEVHKRLWCVEGGELARLSVAGTSWWTIAALTGPTGTSTAAIRLLDSWIDFLAADAKPHSYASWLTELCHDGTHEAGARDMRPGSGSWRDAVGMG